MTDPLTADTVTDEQIRALRKITGWVGSAADDQRLIDIALNLPRKVRLGDPSQRGARARVAKIINARRKQETSK